MNKSLLVAFIFNTGIIYIARYFTMDNGIVKRRRLLIFVEFMYFFDHLNYRKKNNQSFIISFENVSLEVVSMLYLLEQKCSNIKLKKPENSINNNDFEFSYQVDSSANKDKLSLSSLAILLNTNTRYEGYVLNLNMRQRFLKGNFKLLSIGSTLDITLPVSNLGSNMNILKSIGEGTHIFCQDINSLFFN